MHRDSDNGIEEKLRRKLPEEFPGAHFSFDPGDLVSQTLNFGTPSVIEVAVTSPQYNDALEYAQKIEQQLRKIGELRDLGYEELLHYPTVSVQVDRVMAGQLGTTADRLAKQSFPRQRRADSFRLVTGAIPNRE